MFPRITFSKIVKDFMPFTIKSKRFSALFMNGPKATENFMYVTPHINFSDYLKRKTVIKEELIKRQATNDLNQLENLWGVYEDLMNRKLQLTEKKDKISKELNQKLNTDDPELEKLKLQHKLLKENISKLKIPLWSAEEAAVIEYLKLPNKLHSLTPIEENVIVHEYKSPPSNNKNHVRIGEEQDLLYFNKNMNYYLKNDAAVFELGSQFYFSQLLKHNNFVQFSNPDFCKSFIVEGCGQDPTDTNSTFILHHNEEGKVNMENRLHLTGAGAVSSFFAYHAKNVIYGTALPLKYFSMGRKYAPAPSNGKSLFNVTQSSVVQTFIVTQNLAELNKLMNEVINVIKVSYEELGYHFRLICLPAHRLESWESLRLSIEMFSCSLNNYVEIGNLSVSEDFISKRLMFTYANGKENKYPFVMSGTILNVPKFLACVLEQDGPFSIPLQFRVEKWSC